MTRYRIVDFQHVKKLTVIAKKLKHCIIIYIRASQVLMNGELYMKDEYYYREMLQKTMKTGQNNLRLCSNDFLVKKLLVEINRNTLITKSLETLMTEVEILQNTILQLSDKT